MSPSVRRARLAALVLAPALLAGCVATPDTGISMQKVQADIVFGAKSADAAAPPNASVPDARVDGIEPSADIVEADDVVHDDKRFLSRLPPIRRPVTACPDAGPTAFAPMEAPLNPVGTPRPGIYRWKRAGTQEVATLPGLKVPITGFERRLVSNVQSINASDYRFDVAQSELGGPDLVVTTYKVRTAAASTRVPTTNTRQGEPDRGLSIEKIERFDSKTGQPKGRAFQPQPPVLVLPLPVVPGEQFQSVGIDPSTLQTMQLDVQVTKREQVDACGELVDGWVVETTRTLSGAETSQGKYTVVIATQLGAMPVQERVDMQDGQGHIAATFTVGQVAPDAAGGGS